LSLFCWPFLGTGLPDNTPAWALMVACVVALLAVEAGTRQLDSRGIALLAAIAAIDAVLRLTVIIGVGGFNPIFFLVLCAGFVFGPSFGFMAGALSLLVSAVLGGGIGPWVPYQVFALGWVGAAAGVVGLGRAPTARLRDVALLAVVGAFMGYVFGALMSVTDWIPFFRGNPTLGWSPGMDAMTALQHYARFYFLTAFAYDTFRAVGNAVMVLTLGAPVIAALGRFRARLTFDVVTA
jgi:energy-coupling factor transport system substrate-specific component